MYLNAFRISRVFNNENLRCSQKKKTDRVSCLFMKKIIISTEQEGKEGSDFFLQIIFWASQNFSKSQNSVFRARHLHLTERTIIERKEFGVFQNPKVNVFSPLSGDGVGMDAGANSLIQEAVIKNVYKFQGEKEGLWWRHKKTFSLSLLSHRLRRTRDRNCSKS